jgi:predicted dienelactone hydrolase
VRRRRAAAVLVLCAIVAGLAYLASTLRGPARRPAAATATHAGAIARAPYAVRELDATYVDRSRWVSLPDGTRAPRRLVTRILYPGVPAGERLAARFALIVFGHGYALEPRVYWPLLTAWARAGYVVAAPVFPLENAGAPGGPTHADESNEPADMSFVISRALAAATLRGSPLHGLLNGQAIAVAGHSDGGDAALAVAEGSNRDHRVRAAIVLDGAALPGLTFDSGGPPLLAVQASADALTTNAFLSALAVPKFHLTLTDAGSALFGRQSPELGVVQRVTLAFLDRYVNHDGAASARLTAAGNAPGIASLSSRS